MKLRKGSLVSLIVAVFVSFVFLGGSALAADVIKIGVVAPLTGSFADEGNEMYRGVEMAVEQLNAKGGILGKKIKLIKGDIGDFSGEKIVGVGEKLIYRDKVDFLTTQYLGGVVDIKTFGEYEVPYLHMDTSQSAADLVRANLEKYSNIFQTCPEETHYAGGILDFLDRVFPKATGYKYPNKKMALITMVRAYNDRISKRYKGLLKNTDWELVVDEKTPTGTVEWGPVLAKIRQEKPAVIFFNDHVPSDEVAFLDQFHANPTNSVIFIQYGPSNPAFISLGKEKTNDIFWGTLFGTFGKQGNDWRARYKEKYGEEAGIGTAAGTYTNTMIWANSVMEAGDEKNYKEVSRIIRENPHRYTGMLHVFNPETQTAICGEGLAAFLAFQVRNQKHELVSPLKFGTSKVKVPYWVK